MDLAEGFGVWAFLDEGSYEFFQFFLLFLLLALGKRRVFFWLWMDLNSNRQLF